MDIDPLKSAVYLGVAKAVEQQVSMLGQDTAATPAFVASLVDLVYNQLVLVGQDLELFSRHADRSTILPVDMYLLTRRNNTLTRALQLFHERTN